MANHRIDIDAVENPMQLLGRKPDDRLLAAGPPELVLGQPLVPYLRMQPRPAQSSS
jgi:hypothetical protein